MINAVGLKFIDHRSTTVLFYDLYDCGVERNIKKKYRINKVNAFDPTALIKRDPYWDDTISITFISSPEGLNNLLAFLEDSNKLYVEYYHNGQLRQYAVTEVTALPKESDVGRFFNNEYKMEIRSIYIEPLNIDFGDLQSWDLSWGDVWNGSDIPPEQEV